MKVITVIYDGHCDLCKNSIDWLAKKLSFDAIAFQSADLASFRLTRSECEKQVYAISGAHKFAGVKAIIFLLNKRGNKISSLLLKLSGPIGALGYRMIAANRKSLIVKLISKSIAKIT